MTVQRIDILKNKVDRSTARSVFILCYSVMLVRGLYRTRLDYIGENRRKTNEEVGYVNSWQSRRMKEKGGIKKEYLALSKTQRHGNGNAVHGEDRGEDGLTILETDRCIIAQEQRRTQTGNNPFQVSIF
ncbi:hypothetical protein PoB_005672500 [Plakobranchus ocellatus]|uniref:Uncharacterized protein n=1 Tax=Plakobranchus ocellatus TaxID=259542 RepID=A0AAV4CBU7_9GAST|nr:hypothetical protein PoB_005672500 [Plakobranchus ocellatus]